MTGRMKYFSPSHHCYYEKKNFSPRDLLEKLDILLFNIFHFLR
jgi:hypothetical protein